MSRIVTTKTITPPDSTDDKYTKIITFENDRQQKTSIGFGNSTCTKLDNLIFQNPQFMQDVTTQPSNQSKSNVLSRKVTPVNAPQPQPQSRVVSLASSSPSKSSSSLSLWNMNKPKSPIFTATSTPLTSVFSTPDPTEELTDFQLLGIKMSSMLNKMGLIEQLQSGDEIQQHQSNLIQKSQLQTQQEQQDPNRNFFVDINFKISKNLVNYNINLKLHYQYKSEIEIDELPTNLYITKAEIIKYITEKIIFQTSPTLQDIFSIELKIKSLLVLRKLKCYINEFELEI
ncbi:uncharacterized protein KGF55_003633 [Candida pseudojiufengensis]|uniref:uncharacterized protein n=1 Tax=Candida pseudojiufengensis TaxID=497109 RepID=UPI00222443AB|nr:uncharacterized protein KGF55_003633 [Candida pseudojiufengensis]KAI5962557.1 hypothetical protein KGF55_003633 [Candida pseudojiufengensis]